MLTPQLDTLPVYVRGGAILPVQPLVQSTDETPTGPLTLRVYVPATGSSCNGDVYADDGHSFNYRSGDYFRMHATCSAAADGSLNITLGAAEGHYKPWFKQLRIEVIGASQAPTQASLRGSTVKLETSSGVAGLTIDLDTKGSQISIR